MKKILAVLAIMFTASFVMGDGYSRFTKTWEGFSPTPYKDAEGRSIGYGFFLNRADASIRLKAVGVTGEMRVTKDQAQALLAGDIQRSIEDCKKMFPSFDSLPRNVRLVLVDLNYNLGSTRFRKFKKFRAAVNRRDWDASAAELVSSLWFEQVGKRSRNHVAMLRSL